MCGFKLKVSSSSESARLRLFIICSECLLQLGFVSSITPKYLASFDNSDTSSNSYTFSFLQRLGDRFNWGILSDTPNHTSLPLTVELEHRHH